MVKRPSFQFYPADWLNDIKLQSCSLSSQGLLMNLICLMHQSEKYGYLMINGSIPPNKEVSRLLRLHHKTYDKSLIELITYGVLSEDGSGTLFCPRMVKDEYIREVRREAGSKGGSPLLKQQDKQRTKQKQTPSSSPSSPSPSLGKDSSEVQGPTEPIIIEMPLISKNGLPPKTHPIYQSDIDDWADAYPTLDILSRLKAIRQWSISNPLKQKTAKGIRRHITTWLEKDHNSGKFKGGIDTPPEPDQTPLEDLSNDD